MLKALFPDKQLLIRQNGDVKYLTLPSWLQVMLFFVGLAVCIIAGAGSYQYVELNGVITEQQQVIEQKQSELDALHLSYREKHSELSSRISQIDEKSQLMTNMLESLPEAQQEEFQAQQDATQKENAPVQPIQTEQQAKTSDTETKPEDADAIKKAQDKKQDSKPEPKAESEGESDTQDDSTSEETIENDIARENQLLDTQFTTLAQVVDGRTESLLKALEKAGVDHTTLINKELDETAQGGPFNAVDASVLSKDQQALLDKIVVLNQLSSNLELLPTSLPAKAFYVSSSYGLRTDPVTKRRAMHRGVDLAGWHKTEIFAPAHGTVKRAGRNGGYGKFIEIEHKNGFVTRYGHLAKINVKRGQEVQKDQVIGLMGNSGRSTGTHLHYEILHNEKHINPLKLTKAFENVLQ
ncbi:peptidoglycan DD-metalloendopeptidase family protein [Pseudoalteromonas spongiae]|uniref:peptidoglycan DD-metalloendopeptidase family protein n=1 Tax=Pseudoalteromonas spongiae TaxID=298657 RepID=UPI0037362689